jgi:hypothetical protein
LGQPHTITDAEFGAIRDGLGLQTKRSPMARFEQKKLEHKVAAKQKEAEMIASYRATLHEQEQQMFVRGASISFLSTPHF